MLRAHAISAKSVERVIVGAANKSLFKISPGIGHDYCLPEIDDVGHRSPATNDQKRHFGNGFEKRRDNQDFGI